jgi:general secretion pathway protein I
VTRGREAGFTLIEVVVAFVLLAAVLGVVIEIFSTGMARASDMEHYSRALLIAQSKLASAGIEETLAEGEKAGESEDGNYRWMLSVRRSEEGEAAAQSAQLSGRPMVGGYTLYRLDTRVSWKGATGAERSVSLATLQLGQNK